MKSVDSRSQGYSVVEIGIVLAAIALLVTSAMWPFAEHFRNDQREGTADYMEAVQDSILAYAAENRTPGAEVVFRHVTSAVPPETLAVTVYMPSGRPVLPCPDLDGDGLEDRTYQIASPVTVSLGFGTTPDRNAVVNLDNTPGRCLDDKGLLPWRTLRTQPIDYWGQSLTYWVDGNFAHGLFGFDQTTRGSRVFKHVVVPNGAADGYMYLPHTDILVAGGPNGVFTFRDESQPNPSRHTLFGQGVVVSRTDVNRSDPPLQPRLSHSLELTGSNDLALMAGEPLARDLARHRQTTEKRRLFRPDGRLVDVHEYLALHIQDTVVGHEFNLGFPDMANGIAFALVSHGANGRGGVVYEPDMVSASSFTCRNFAFASADIRRHSEEMRNARRTNECSVNQLFLAECTPASREQGCGNPANGANSVFMIRKPTLVGGNTQVEFDDIVAWMHPEELATTLSKTGTLPQTPPPVAFFNIPYYTRFMP